MGNNNTTTTESTLLKENQELKQQLKYVHQRYVEERERGDQLIRDARFVGVSTAAILLLGGTATLFFAFKRFKRLEDASRSLQRRLELAEREHASQVERMTTSFERNREAAKLSGAADVAKSVLGISDDLDRMLSSSSNSSNSSSNLVDDMKILHEGLKMTRANLTKAFLSKNVDELNPKGEKFDPNLYEAVDVVRDETLQDEEIVSVEQTGFVMGDRILRPARVVVNKKKKKNK
jgi:molecular chaperone GrpE